MNEHTSMLRIPDAGEEQPDGRYADRPVLRTSMGGVGTNLEGQEVDVAVDVDLDDGIPYVSVIVVGQNGPTDKGEGDDAVLEFTQTDHVRTLAAKLLEAADALDAMTGEAPA